MNIVINNNPEEIQGTQITITELLKFKNFTFKMLIVKINGELVRKTDYDTARVNDGDEVMVLHLISGG